jgi:hypothetical protein
MFLSCFENARVIMCWAHAKKNIDAKISQRCNKKYAKEILTDISKLKLAKSDEAFMLLYLYEGAGPAVPSTNNALESTNAAIKREDTFMERKELNEFKIMHLDTAKKWSDYALGLKKICIFTETLLGDGYGWTKEKKSDHHP